MPLDERHFFGSRFIAGERHLTVQVLALSTRLKSRLPSGTEQQDIAT